jgi:hypothetical protein
LWCSPYFKLRRRVYVPGPYYSRKKPEVVEMGQHILSPRTFGVLKHMLINRSCMNPI